MAVTIVVNGYVIPSAAAGIVISGNVMVPFPGVVERIVTRFSRRADGQIEFDRDGHVLLVRIGARAAVVDGRVVSLPVAPSLIGRSLYVPLGAVGRALGEDILFDRPTQTVSIFTPMSFAVSPMTPLPSGATRIRPHVIFTPREAVTPRPLISPPVDPRRTPIAAFGRTF